MNELCKCDGANCIRHQMMKTRREREFCSGTADTSDNGLAYWQAWERGQAGATAPEKPELNPSGFGRASAHASEKTRSRSSVGTQLHRIIRRETGRDIPCPVCQEEINTLDRLSVEDAAGERIRIVDGIYRRAWTHASWQDWLKLAIDRGVMSVTMNRISPAKWIIGGWFDEAIETGAEPVKKKRRGSVRPAVAVEFQGEAFPFTSKPHITLVFHCWPKRGGWERHIEKIKAIEHRFDRTMMGVAIGADGCDTYDQVRETFGDSWEYKQIENDPTRGECDTLQWAVDTASNDINAVTFYCHSKGTKEATKKSEPVRWWTDCMWETVIWNVDAVLEQLERGAKFAGSLRYVGNFFPSHNDWHYSGSYFAFRNAHVIGPNCKVREQYYGTEAFPSDHSKASESVCMFEDIRFPHLYSAAEQPRRELFVWRAKNKNGVIASADYNIGED